MNLYFLKPFELPYLQEHVLFIHCMVHMHILLSSKDTGFLVDDLFSLATAAHIGVE